LAHTHDTSKYLFQNKHFEVIPVSLIKGSTLYAGKIAKYKAFILITSCSNYKINNAVVGDFNK